VKIRPHELEFGRLGILVSLSPDWSLLYTTKTGRSNRLKTLAH